ncbi:MAG: hypothetical protein HYT98_03235 [Candidatus Sungbacteria bacterium]|nr:hypothetical protein [Candidatus Sungbacteria bacterium]
MKARMLIGGLMVIFLVFFAGNVSAEWPKVCEGQPPHYLRGFTQTNDQIDAFKQMQLNFAASRSDSSLLRARWASNIGESATFIFYGHTVSIYFPMYQRLGNVVYYYTAAGATPLTVEEFECVKEDFGQWIQQAIDANYDDHRRITDLAVESFAAGNNMTPDAVRKLIARPIPEYGTNYGDVLKIPLLEPADFIKGVKHIYFTSMSSCNAWVYLQTIVAFSPCTRRWDYIMGYPTVAKHELIHANAKLQGFPIGWYSNMELFAALLPFLEQPTDLETFFYHGYLSKPWEALEVFGSFDVAKIRKEFFRYDVWGGGSAMNREVIAEYLSEINKAAEWLRESGLKVLAKFYTDPHFWVAVNDMSHDDDMAYMVIMAGLYEPTALGGHDNTVRFILKHSDQSKSIADGAWSRVGKSRSLMFDERRQKALEELVRFADALGISKEELIRKGRAYGFRSEHLENMDLDLAREILRSFLSGDGVFGKPIGSKLLQEKEVRLP